MNEFINSVRHKYSALTANVKFILRFLIAASLLGILLFITQNITGSATSSIFIMKFILFSTAVYGFRFVFFESEDVKQSRVNIKSPGFLDELRNYGIKTHAVVVGLCTLFANIIIFHATGAYPSSSSALAITASLLIIIYAIMFYLLLLSVFSLKKAYIFSSLLPAQPKRAPGFIELALDKTKPDMNRVFILYISRLIGCLSIAILSAQYFYIILVDGLIFDFKSAYRIESNRSLPVPEKIFSKPDFQYKSPLIFALHSASTKQDCLKSANPLNQYVPIDASRSVMIPRVIYQLPNEEGILIFADGIRIVFCDRKP